MCCHKELDHILHKNVIIIHGIGHTLRNFSEGCGLRGECLLRCSSVSVPRFVPYKQEIQVTSDCFSPPSLQLVRQVKYADTE